MFDTKVKIPWKRTGKKEYPENNQLCLIYFQDTGFSISKYIEEENTKEDIANGLPLISRSFIDDSGFLGDEDVLWVPISQDLPPFGSYKHLALPEDYVKDRKFMKWNDPQKIYKWVELTVDYTWEELPYLSHRDKVLKGTRIGVTGESSTEVVGVFIDEKGQLNQAVFLKSACKDIISSDNILEGDKK